MNTCEKLIEQVQAMIGYKPIVTGNLRPAMSESEGGEWVRKDDVIAVVKEADNAA